MARPKGSKNKVRPESGSSAGRTSAGKASRRSGRKKTAAENLMLADEITVIVVILISGLLLLSNMGLCGPFGILMRSVQLGLFGILGYLFPFVLCGSTLFLMSNLDNAMAVKRMIMALVLLILISGIFQILGPGTEDMGLMDLYHEGTDGNGGGMVGGALALLLGMMIGKAGTVLVMLILSFLCLVYVTGKPLGRIIAGKSMHYAGRARIKAKENMAAMSERAKQRREIREREKAELAEREASEAKETEEVKETKEAIHTIDPAEGEMLRDVGPLPSAATGRSEVELMPSGAAGHAETEAFTAAAPVISDEALFSKIDEKLNEAVSLEAQTENALSSMTFLNEKSRESFILESNRDDGIDLPLNPVHRQTVFSAVDGEQTAFSAADGEQAETDLTGLRFRSEPAIPETEETEAVADTAGIVKTAATEADSTSPEAETIVPFVIHREEQKSLFSDNTDIFGAAETGTETESEPETQAETETEAEAETEIEEEVLHIATDHRGRASFSVGDPETGIRRIETSSGMVIETDVEPLLKKTVERNYSQDAASGQALQEAQHSQAEQRPHAEQEVQAEQRSEGADARPDRAVKAANAPTPQDELKTQQEILKNQKVKKPYVFPPLSLLHFGGSQDTDSVEEIRSNAQILQDTLKSFGVAVTVTDVSVGPAVTRYELQPEIGVKVSKIVSLTNDIKMRLAAADIRIEAPIPGKSAVGIEVPNKHGATVYLGDVLNSREFRDPKAKISFGVGKDIAGKIIAADIGKMPHLLIAGATGSGKSVSINTLIMSILYKYKPEEVRMIMVDPKVVELSVYNGIPHLLIPVVTEPKKAAAALNWAVAEMTDRYKKFAETGCRDLAGYNQKIERVRNDPDIPEEKKPVKLPQIVIIIDELADLMMVASSEVEDAICRIAQLARAAGMHLVIATQRPTVDVITGLIKANVPSRIAFAVSSGTDSRTILDMNGAEKLLGKGDMLFFPQGIPKPVRVQGAFVSDQEVQAVVDFIRSNGEASYDEMVENSVQNSASMPGSAGGSDRDELFGEAGAIIIESKKASIGMLQRKFRIGFNRAARIMDQLSEAGVVGPEEGTKPRRILMDIDTFDNYLSTH